MKFTLLPKSKKGGPARRSRTSIKVLAIALVTIVTVTVLLGAGWFIGNVLYGESVLEGEVAGSGRQSAQVDAERVDAMKARLDAKTEAPLTPVEELRSQRNPFRTLTPPPAEPGAATTEPTAEPAPPTIQ